MMEQRRTAAGVAGQAEFTLEFEPEIVTRLGMDWLVAWLEDSMREGSRFLEGETVGIGWLNCYVVDREDGTLGLCEPDFENVPPILAAGASKTVSQLWLQREVAESLGLGYELDFPHYVQYAMTCAGFADAESVIMQRYEGGEEDESGWFLRCLGVEHEHDSSTLQLCTLYELAVMKPVIVGYLALPPGCTVTLGESIPSIVRDGADLQIREGSLLATMFGDALGAL